MTDKATLSGDPEYVYRERKHEVDFSAKPWCVYFYYIGKDAAGYKAAQHYTRTRHDRPFERQELDWLVRELALNARRGTNKPPQDGADWKHIVWTRKSYLIILIDDPATVLISGQALAVDAAAANGAPNHTLYDAWDMLVDTSDKHDGSMMVTAIACINHMKKNEIGEDIGDTPEYFKLDLLSMPPLPHPIYPDSGGTNMGPPVGPP